MTEKRSDIPASDPKRSQARRLRTLRITLALIGLFMMPWLLFEIILLKFGRDVGRSSLDNLMVLIGFTVLCLTIWGLTAFFKINRLSKRLSVAPENNSVEELLAVYPQCMPGRKEAVREAILNALSESNASQVGRLERDEVAQLVRYAQQPDREMALASLRVIAELGGEADLPALKRLATSVRVERIDPEVRARARECVAAIERRIASQPKELELLRSSENPEEASSLLRSSQASPTTDEETVLLRSVGRNAE